MINRIARSIREFAKARSKPIRQVQGKPPKRVQVVRGKKEGDYYLSEDPPLRSMIYPSPSELVQLAISKVNEYKNQTIETTLDKKEGQ